MFIKLWLEVKHSTLNRYFVLELIEFDVFQMPQPHKHFNVRHQASPIPHLTTSS
jgi:hypothetical protein